MNEPSAIPSAEHLNLLGEVVGQVTRMRRLKPHDAEDFAQSVQVWLLERNYEVFHRFAGRSSLRTYLTVVVNRLLIDWHNSMYGKWRPSAAARRLGDVAVRLERLIYRDGCSAGDAVERTRRECGATASRLLELVERLPVRHRRVTISADALASVPAPGSDDVIEAAERGRDARRIGRAVAAGLRQLTREDRWLIHARYQQGRSVQAVARALHVEPKLLYRRYERVLRLLRTAVRASLSIGRDARADRKIRRAHVPSHKWIESAGAES